jgi:hypothetical protein
VDPERLGDDLAHGHPRVQRGVRILEDDLDLAPDRPHLTPLEARDVAAVEEDRAGRRLEQLDDRAPERRLAAARLADDAERLALADGKVDPVDCADGADGVLEDARLDRKVLDEPLDP